jgi:hypothetical protein
MGAQVGLSACGNFEDHHYLHLMRAQCPEWLRGEIPAALAKAHADMPPQMLGEQKMKMKSCCESFQKAVSSIDVRHLSAESEAHVEHEAQLQHMGNVLFDAVTGAGVNNGALNHVNDSNPCADDEEDLKGLCYKRCSNITNMTHNIRVSPWGCCRTHNCNPLTDMTWDVGICSGFDVAGDSQGGTCPHTHGACLPNEELFLGFCYKRCSDLTDRQYPYRSGVIACCRVRGLGCLRSENTDFSFAYGRGGGGEDMDPSTPGIFHPPLAKMTR